MIKEIETEYKKRLMGEIWLSKARSNQIPPNGDWLTWMIMAGRGFGKTWAGAQAVYHWIRNDRFQRIALIGESQKDVESIMLYGESGLFNIEEKTFPATYKKSEHLIVWPNGTKAFLFGAQFPEKLRGHQFDCAWVDELAKFPNPERLWEQLMFCLRLGNQPRCIVTTTPKPIPFLKKLKEQSSTVVSHGSSFENKNNLSPHFFSTILKPYMGTKIGQQEIEGVFLDQKEGSLWHHGLFCHKTPEDVTFVKTILAIDPAISCKESSDETGLIVAAKDTNGMAWILCDSSGKLSAMDWSKKAKYLCELYQVNTVVVETNQGGDLLETLLKLDDCHLPIQKKHARHSKLTRAEPVARLYEQGKVIHVPGLSTLENQLCQYDGTGKSPDRMDALVWAITELLIPPKKKPACVWTL